MQDRPVIVKEGGNSVAMFAILAILVIVGAALFMWQPWNASGSTTKVIVQPGTQSGASSGSGGGTTSGSSSGGSSSGSSSGSSH